MRDEGEQSNTTVCEACFTAVPSYDVVSYGSIDRGYRELCTRCFNAEVANVLGLERFEHVQLQPIVMTDCAGEKHEFHFQDQTARGRDGARRFRAQGRCAGWVPVRDAGGTGRRTIVAARQPDRADAPQPVRPVSRPCEDGAHIADQTVCGRIEWDASGDGRMPLLVIDGRDVSWDEFGRMLMSFEGWQFRVAIRDRSEEV